MWWPLYEISALVSVLGWWYLKNEGMQLCEYIYILTHRCCLRRCTDSYRQICTAIQPHSEKYTYIQVAVRVTIIIRVLYKDYPKPESPHLQPEASYLNFKPVNNNENPKRTIWEHRHSSSAQDIRIRGFRELRFIVVGLRVEGCLGLGRQSSGWWLQDNFGLGELRLLSATASPLALWANPKCAYTARRGCSRNASNLNL